MAEWLEVGQKAPAFTLKDDQGNTVKLSELKGKPVVLYFYPRDDTPGCTKQACGFRDHYDELLKLGVHLFGISADSAESHAKFREKHALPFPLLVDEKKSMLEKYGAWREKVRFGKRSMGIQRSTYILDAEGKIAKLWKAVKVDGHETRVLEEVQKLLGGASS